MQIVTEQKDCVLVKVSKAEIAIYAQVLIEKIAEGYDDEDSDDSTLLIMMAALEPGIKFALPSTIQLFKEMKEGLNESVNEDEVAEPVTPEIIPSEEGLKIEDPTIEESQA